MSWVSNIAVVFKNNKIEIIPRATTKEIYEEKYEVLAYVNKPYNPHYVGIIKRYFDAHPEKTIQYFLK